MPLASLFKRQKAAPADPTPAAEDDGPVQQARVRARRRLIGAVVLMGVGVVLFPLLFETQPRPLPRDIPIEVARKDAEPAPTPPSSAPLKAEASLGERETLEPPSPAPAGASTAAAAPTAPPEPASASVARAEPAPTPAASRPAPDVKAVASAPREAARPAAETVAKAPAPPASAKPPAASASSPASAPGPGRFVVQVGAFTDPAAVREARQRVEKLGFKSYTQEIETASGKRTRVRAGPFATREEADRAGARIKAAGLPAYMLAL